MRPSRSKSATFTVRLSPAELFDLHRESMREQLSASELIRRWIARASAEAAGVAAAKAAATRAGGRP